MTSTTTEIQQAHEHPCFCDSCLMATIDDLTRERAQLLHAALTDRLYDPGLESRMAEEIIAAIPVASRGDVLKALVTWDHLMPRVMAVDCLLDETDSRSYDALTAMAGILLDAIHAQGTEGRALQAVMVNEICGREKLLRRSAA